MATTPPSEKKPLVSSILLWMRTDQPRRQGMDYWKGPHSKIASATPGLEEYRQIHLAENNPGLWPAISGVETVIPAERKVDGLAELTFQSLLSPIRGRQQAQLLFEDEVNVFQRTLLYAGPPNSSLWYNVASAEETTGARSLIYLRRREDVKTAALRKLLNDEVVPALFETGALSELRTQIFMPWTKRLWNTPNVAHDNPTDRRFHASMSLGFTDTNALRALYDSRETATLSGKLPEIVSALHAYEVAETLTYVKDGQVLPHYQT